MNPPRIVIDTNVVVSALRSSMGTSHVLLSLVGTDAFEVSLSVPLVLEYEKALRDSQPDLLLSPEEVEEVLDYLCAHSDHTEVFFLWRPYLKDPGDDMVLELAVASQSPYIVTFNRRDFRGAEDFGIRVLTPKELLKKIGELP